MSLLSENNARLGFLEPADLEGIAQKLPECLRAERGSPANGPPSKPAYHTRSERVPHKSRTICPETGQAHRILEANLLEILARPARLERATCGFEVRRSIQLSYGRACR